MAVYPPSPPSLSMPSSSAEPSYAYGHAHASLPPQAQTPPSPSAQHFVAEARTAVVASMGNLLDTELQSRASLLHSNAMVLDKQEGDVVRATDMLRQEREKLAREVEQAARKVKEVGDVQNWAELLERGFLVLEETIRLANGGDEEGSGSEGGNERGSCTEGGWSDGDGDDDGDDADRGREQNRLGNGNGNGNGNGSLRRRSRAEVMDDLDDLRKSLHNGRNGTTLEDSRDGDSAVSSQQNGHLDVMMNTATATDTDGGGEECVI
ncbi:hypothetical protein E4U56_001453 [Claviceps arundinis]|uniref:Biogenesis of lysosome-related organelles complex 1 subunit 1 n=1 Tax=Claviceps arundinis TaxID=1623583 RepID=A0A9P7MYE9_9HYPO|nr:hypothetical protein E4U56_001453 [Claviceps arundinis]